MEQNRFKKYNTSLLVNVFISNNDYKLFWNIMIIPKYNRLNIKNIYGWSALMDVCSLENENISRLLLNHSSINIDIKDKKGITALSKKLINMLKKHNEKQI